jgi:hypothetical protein
MRLIPAAAICLALFSCANKEEVLIVSEINMLGQRHDLTYKGDTLTQIIYSTFIANSETDSADIDTLIRRDVDSIVYESDNSISLLRTFSRHGSYGKIHRRFRFNSDNLLTSISRFNGRTEYTTDSVAYDYTAHKAFYFDFVNKVVEELEYDRDDNITSIIEQKIPGSLTSIVSDAPRISPEPIQTTYYYFSSSKDPFLGRLDDDEMLFGCFHRSSVGLFWNGGLSPKFSSVNNVQAIKQTRNSMESNALFEYQMKDGLPTARYGGYGVVYYRYKKK